MLAALTPMLSDEASAQTPRATLQQLLETGQVGETISGFLYQRYDETPVQYREALAELNYGRALKYVEMAERRQAYVTDVGKAMGCALFSRPINGAWYIGDKGWQRHSAADPVLPAKRACDPKHADYEPPMEDKVRLRPPSASELAEPDRVRSSQLGKTTFSPAVPAGSQKLLQCLRIEDKATVQYMSDEYLLVSNLINECALGLWIEALVGSRDQQGRCRYMNLIATKVASTDEYDESRILSSWRKTDRGSGCILKVTAIGLVDD
jgi:uncharacterized protein YdbL (DUF1318 family)